MEVRLAAISSLSSWCREMRGMVQSNHSDYLRSVGFAETEQDGNTTKDWLRGFVDAEWWESKMGQWKTSAIKAWDTAPVWQKVLIPIVAALVLLCLFGSFVACCCCCKRRRRPPATMFTAMHHDSIGASL